MTRATILILSLLLVSHLTCAKILVIGRNQTLSFEDMEANFTPAIKKADQCGVLYVAEPLNACSELVNTVIGSTVSPPYVLIVRGGCSFEEKIRNAQKAGYKAAIVYDNEDYGFLVSMAGNPSGVTIYATFVSKSTGEMLKEYVGRTDVELWLMPSFENSAWSIMAISFISLLAMSAVLATCFFVRRHRVRRRRVRSRGDMEFPPMSINSIRRMPTIVFTGVCEVASTSTKCAICQENYKIGDILRILPCRHKFHATCIDVWLGKWRSYCPVCRHDARTGRAATERTPLLSPSLSPVSSFYSSSSPSSTTQSQSSEDLPVFTRQDTPLPYTMEQYLSRSHSHTSYQNGPFRSSPISVSRSSLDLRNFNSQKSYNPPRQGSLPRLVQSRSTHILSPGNNSASSSWVAESSRQRERSLPRFDSSSSGSLPDC